ncbi:MAG: hypothetical protein AABX66_00895 [Nanoarchaeota archaeon]
MNFNKKGNRLILGTLVTLAIIPFVSALNLEEIANLSEEIITQITSIIKTLAKYLFGSPTTLVSDPTSALIISVAIWLLITVTFGDILSSFSAFSKRTSWIIAGLMGIISANLGLSNKIITATTGVFTSFGIYAIYIGLGTAFIVFIIVNLGITQAGPWIMKRKMMIEASKAEIETEAGARKLKGTIKALESVGESLKETGEKK